MDLEVDLPAVKADPGTVALLAGWNELRREFADSPPVKVMTREEAQRLAWESPADPSAT